MFRRNVLSHAVLPVRTMTKTKARQSADAEHSGKLESVCQKHVNIIERLRHTLSGLIIVMQEIWHYKIEMRDQPIDRNYFGAIFYGCNYCGPLP